MRALIFLTAAALLITGCENQQAKIYCQKIKGLNGQALAACRESFGILVDKYDSDLDPDQEIESCERERDRAIRGIPGEPMESDAWFDAANRINNLHNGCKAGVMLYFEVIEMQTAPKTPGCFYRINSYAISECLLPGEVGIRFPD